jgi:hypothetical protein
VHPTNLRAHQMEVGPAWPLRSSLEIELLGQLPRRGDAALDGPVRDWTATKNGMLGTLLSMIQSGEIAHARTRTELLTAITAILDAGRAAGDLRPDVTAEDIAAALIGIFTVAPRPEREASASRLLNLLMDGLRPPPRRIRPA